MALPLAIAFIILFTWRTILVVQQRREKDSVQGQVFWKMCQRIDTEVLSLNSSTRITLFTRDPLRPNYLTARYRYSRGNLDPIKAASVSKARYKSGEGFTGAAWQHPSSLFVAVFPTFDARSDFEDWYIQRVGVNSSTVRDLSNHMVQVRSILSYGLEDGSRRSLGVVSLDFEEVIVTEEDSALPVGLLDNVSGDDMLVRVNAHQIRELLRVVQWILEAFAKA